MVLSLVIVWLFGMCLFGFGVWVIAEDNNIFGWVLAIFGAFFVIVATFVIAPLAFPNGLPHTSISSGEYKAAFVYVAGENVNVGVEKKNGEDNNECLYLYQFPKSAFDDSINTNAKKLVVVESNGFKKLILK